MKVQNEIIANEVEVSCPYCGRMQSGWFGDPRGSKEECEDCGETFLIHQDADIEMW